MKKVVEVLGDIFISFAFLFMTLLIFISFVYLICEIFAHALI